MLLKQTKLTDLDRKEKYDFIIPIGSTEQHSTFLPFGTDTYVTDAMIARLNEDFPQLLILPTLEYSCSREHEGFIGTVWLSEETFHNVLRDVCVSLQPYARSISFITGHGGNLRPIDEFVAANKNNFDTAIIQHISFNDDAVNEKIIALIGGPCDEHAGNSEISLLYTVYPELVRLPTDADKKTPVENPWETGRIIDMSADGMADANPEWYVSGEFGKKVFDWLYEEIKKQVHEILN